MTTTVSSEEGTARVASALAARLSVGQIVCLRGDLGAGKTTFTRHLLAAFGSPARVSSPTFTLVHEYEGGRVNVAHLDCYRLSGEDDFLASGLDDYLNSEEWLTLIEWPERIERLLPETRVEVELTPSPNNGEPEVRKITIRHISPKPGGEGASDGGEGAESDG